MDEEDRTEEAAFFSPSTAVASTPSTPLLPRTAARPVCTPVSIPFSPSFAPSSSSSFCPSFSSSFCPSAFFLSCPSCLDICFFVFLSILFIVSSSDPPTIFKPSPVSFSLPIVPPNDSLIDSLPSFRSFRSFLMTASCGLSVAVTLTVSPSPISSSPPSSGVLACPFLEDIGGVRQMLLP